MRTFLSSMFVIYLIGATGWIMNIYYLFSSADNSITAGILLQIVGIFVAPLGSILGFFKYFNMF